MPTYTTTTKMEYWLPSDLPDTITDGIKTAAISNASMEIDAMLTKFGLSYNGGTQKFPNITDSPATPEVIDLCAQWVSAYFVYIILKEINKDPDLRMGEILKGKANNRLEKINDGKMDVILSNGTKISFSSTGIYHTHKGVEPRIRKTKFDELGNMLDSYKGSLSAFDQFENYFTNANAANADSRPYYDSFVNVTSLTVTHDLGYNPDVWVMDSDGNAMLCDISYASDMKSFTLSFSESQTGTVYYQ